LKKGTDEKENLKVVERRKDWPRGEKDSKEKCPVTMGVCQPLNFQIKKNGMCGRGKGKEKGNK